MSEQNFLDALKDMMEMDKDGTYSSFKPIQSVEEAKRQEQLMGALKSMGGMDFRPQAINAPSISLQRGGGIIPIQQVQMSDPAGQFAGSMQGLLGSLNQNAENSLPSNTGIDSEGPMLGGLLDLLKQIGQVKNLF
jgi:hypothetical protein